MADMTNFCRDLRLFLAKDKFECVISQYALQIIQ